MASSLGANERLETLENTVQRIRTEHLENVELRRLAIARGSKGVMAAFLLIGFIFVVNALYAYLMQGKQIFEAVHLIWLSIVVAVALVAYFGFIFRFSVFIKHGKGAFGTSQSDK